MMIYVIIGILTVALIMTKIMVAIIEPKEKKKTQEKIETAYQEEEYYNEPILVSAYTVDLSDEVGQIKQVNVEEEIEILEEEATIIQTESLSSGQ